MTPGGADWDTGFFWDSGIQWDINNQGPVGDISPYIALVTSEHVNKAKFMAMLAEVLQPLADIQQLLREMPAAFDLDTAIGVQLDTVGLWIGRTRNLTTPLEGVYFTFDDGPGFDRGILRGPFDPTTQLISLPDDFYRLLLRAVIAADHWDGTVDGAYNAYDIMFANSAFNILIVDHQDMSMTVILTGPIPDAVTRELFLGGYLNLRPDGVRIREYVVSANSDAPIFQFDVPPGNGTGGFDVGAFPEIIIP